MKIILINIKYILKEVKEQFTELSQKEFTTCDQKRIIAVKGRLEDILLGSQSSSEVLEEVLMAINSNVSSEELDKLVEKAEEETVIIKAFIEQYIK